LSRKHAALVWKIHSRRIDQVDDRHSASHRDLLHPKDLAHGFGPPRARLHRSVVCDDHRFSSGDAADPGNYSRCRRLSVVKVVGDQQADLLKVRILIEQKLNSFARGEFVLSVLASDTLRPTAQPETIFKRS